jgi:hypothetical protein
MTVEELARGGKNDPEVDEMLRSLRETWRTK